MDPLDRRIAKNHRHQGAIWAIRLLDLCGLLNPELCMRPQCAAPFDEALRRNGTASIWMPQVNWFQRMYAFLSQVFDYGNTAIEGVVLFKRQQLPLLEFGREREGIDLSKRVLTQRTLRGRGRQAPVLEGDTCPTLDPLIRSPKWAAAKYGRQSAPAFRTRSNG